jgi:hypothetical protein
MLLALYVILFILLVLFYDIDHIVNNVELIYRLLSISCTFIALIRVAFKPSLSQ